MQEMVEPDRTILIVSIIGLVVIWGSVAYHKFLQDGREAVAETEAAGDAAAPADSAPPQPASTGGGTGSGASRRARGKGKKGRR